MHAMGCEGMTEDQPRADAHLLDDEKELLRLEQKATAAEWHTTRFSGGMSFSGPQRVYAGTDMEFGEPHSIPSRFNYDNDAAFIAASRNMAPELLRRLAEERKAHKDTESRLRAENERLRHSQYRGMPTERREVRTGEGGTGDG